MENLLSQAPSIETSKTWAKASLCSVFNYQRSWGNYINTLNFYVAYFDRVPNSISEIKINCQKARQWFLKTYSEQIKDYYYDKRYFKESRKAELDDLVYILFDDLMVYFDTNCDVVRFLFKTTDLNKVETAINGIKKFKARKKRARPEISLLVATPAGIETKALSIAKPNLNIKYNYNNDFEEIHHTIMKRISRKNDKGLILLHGKPGTGKTSYIRYLISTVKKNVIFLPPNMANSITNPDLISTLIDNPNSILVIEDAENIVIDREREGHSPVSALLNISDGLLSDCLNIQIICSFNTDISKVDNALLRKGRLIAKYEFKELEIDKAQLLSDHLGFKTKVNSPMTLTAVYNQEEQDFQRSQHRKAIGFKILEET